MAEPELKKGSSSTIAGTSYMVGKVLGVDGALAEVQTNIGLRKVRVDWTRGNSGTPQAGETWLLDNIYGAWLFALRVGMDDSWHVIGAANEIVMSNGWIPLNDPNYQPPRYSRDAHGFVHLEGMISNPTATTTGTIFVLPVGFRPSARLAFIQAAGGADGTCRVHVGHTGTVALISYIGASDGTSVSLSGIVFGIDR
jgi:hypothetical protein